MKNFFCFLFFLSVFYCEKANSQVSFESEEQLIAQANKLFEASDYVNAMPLFSQLLSLHPKESNYNYKFGVCILFNDEDKTKSLQYFDLAVKDLNVEREGFFFAGRGYHLNARFDEALSFYEKYKSKITAEKPDKFDVVRYIQQCKNGKNLYDKNVTLQALEKTETLENEFYRNYDLKAMKGRIIPKPLNFKSKQDKKVEDNTLIFVGTENQSIVYSGFDDEAPNAGRELFRVNKLPNGEWALPLNIGSPINTPSDEEFAFLHPDGKTLYFSSKGHNTMGGYDIFRSVFDEQTGKWSEPVNFAHPVNSPDDDIFYAADPDETFAYFATKNFTKPGKVKVYKISTKSAEQVNLPVLIKGNFNINAEHVYTKAEIKVTDKTTNTLIGTFNTNRKTGSYLLMLSPGKTYLFDITPEDFVSHRLELTVPAKATEEPFEQKINLQKDAVGETLVMSNFFDATGKTGSNNLRSVLLNDQLAEKAKAENKKVLSQEDFAVYKTQKAEEEKFHADAQKKLLAEIESNKQEAVMKAEAEKKAAEEAKLKAATEAAAKAAAEKKAAEDAKVKAEQEAIAKAEADKKAAAAVAAANAEAKAEQEALAKAEADRKASEEAKLKAEQEKQKAESAAKEKEQQEQLAAAEKQKTEQEEAERERIENEVHEAQRIAGINADILEKERKLKELLDKAKEQNIVVETNRKFTMLTDSLTPEQLAANEKILKEKEESKRIVEEQIKKDNELKEKQKKEDALAQEKYLAEKAAIEKAQQEKEEQNRRTIEEQKLKEKQANEEMQKKNKAVMDSIALAQKEKEVKYKIWVDSLEQAEAKEEMAKAAKEAQELALKAENEKIVREQEQEKLKAANDERNRLIEESIRQQAEMKRVTDSLAMAEKQKEQVVIKVDENEKAKIEEAAAKAEEQRKEAELKASIQKRKAEEEAKAEKELKEKQKAEELAQAKREEEARFAMEKQKQSETAENNVVSEVKATNVLSENETTEQRKLRLLLERMNAEAKGREIVENNLKAQQQSGNETLVNAQRYKEVVTNKEVVQVHKAEEKLRPPFDKNDLLSRKGVMYKLEVKLPPVKLPVEMQALLKAGTGPSEETVYVLSGSYTNLAEATIERNELGYKGFTAGIVAYLDGKEINISEAKQQPVDE